MLYYKMPYGRSTTGRTYKPRFVKSQSTTKRFYQKTAKTNRAAAFSKARKAPVRAIVKNARAITKLKNEAFGPVQTQTSQMSGSTPVTANQPCFFHVNNPNCGTHGPWMYHAGRGINDQHIADYGRYFNVYQNDSDYPFQERNEEHVANGPKLKLLYADFQFRFSGYVPDTRIRIDVVRQKRSTSDIYAHWSGIPLSLAQFLPYTFPGFKQLAGFHPNEIDRKTFEVIKTKHLYMNSHGMSSVVDHAIDAINTGTSGAQADVSHDTVHATTPPVKYYHMRLNLNKIVKQLIPSLSEHSGVDTQAGNALEQENNENFQANHSNYKWSNLHPLSNIWVLISCDDHRSLADIIPLQGAAANGRVQVDVIRKMCWRDPRA